MKTCPHALPISAPSTVKECIRGNDPAAGSCQIWWSNNYPNEQTIINKHCKKWMWVSTLKKDEALV